MTTVDLEVLKLFNCMVADSDERSYDAKTYASYGLVVDFNLNQHQSAAIKHYFQPINVKTLFGREERRNANVFNLISKQLLHYIEVIGLDSPGLFDLEVEGGKIISLRFIRGITVNELEEMVQTLLYQNAPVKDAVAIKTIIDHYKLKFDFDRIENNELRVVLFDEDKHHFEKGDDVVRYICYKATGKLLLIKSKEVIKAVETTAVKPVLFERHELLLANVFNRHKRIIMAAKNKGNSPYINRISRLSKKHHVPVNTPIGKVFLSLALKNDVDASALKQVSIRDKFKILNLIEYKKLGKSLDAFIIRNGKIHIKNNRDVLNKESLVNVENMIIESLKDDLGHLNGKNILLDSSVDYGLPVSRKQAIGNLPFGTTIKVNAERISAGIYWENDWGARDLDLSVIDTDGKRTGWGCYRGYNGDGVVFSGDMVDASNGAMEFMTSEDKNYGLFVNIYNGDLTAGYELVVGSDGKNHWIENTLIREKSSLPARGSVIGFVRGKKFVVYEGALESGRVSGGEKMEAIVSRGMAEFWTVQKLLSALNIQYDVDKDPNKSYDHCVAYEEVSYEKLEKLLLN